MDAGKVVYTLEGWFGGDASYQDNADATVTFLDASGAALGSVTRVGPVTNADRSGQRGLLLRSTSATVPAGARSAQINLYFHKLGPVTDNLDAFADDMVFQLDSIQVTGVANAASSMTGAVAPGEFVSIYGSSLGPAKYAVAVGSQKGLAHAKVTFNGIEAFLTLTSATQINALVPYGVGSKADMVVQYNGLTSDVFPLATTDAAPGIFTQAYGPGQIWATNPDYTFNGASNPVARGGYVSILGHRARFGEPRGRGRRGGHGGEEHSGSGQGDDRRDGCAGARGGFDLHGRDSGERDGPEQRSNGQCTAGADDRQRQQSKGRDDRDSVAGGARRLKAGWQAGLPAPQICSDFFAQTLMGMTSRRRSRVRKNFTLSKRPNSFSRLRLLYSCVGSSHALLQDFERV